MFSAKSRYFPRNLAASSWFGEDVFEFLVVWSHEPRSLGGIVDVFSRHNAEILATQSQLDPSTRTVVGTFYCDMARADVEVERVRKELKNLSFVREVEFAGTRQSPFDKFYFPLFIFGGRRALITRVDGILNMEKRLVQQLGSAGGAIMFGEGESYAAETMKNYGLVLGNLGLEQESILNVVKDGLRATGWGLFDFRVTKEGYEATIQHAPRLEGTTEPSRLVCGIVAGIVESLFSTQVRVVESKADPKADKLFLKFTKIAGD